jgi:hypothetical protein
MEAGMKHEGDDLPFEDVRRELREADERRRVREVMAADSIAAFLRARLRDELPKGVTNFDLNVAFIETERRAGRLEDMDSKTIRDIARRVTESLRERNNAQGE